MKLTLLCAGRMKNVPERDLVDDYLSRARKTGAALGFRAIDEIEIDSRGGTEREGERFLQKLPEGARLIRLDERGKQLRSEAFAELLADIRDSGQDLCFLIGGADGYCEDVIKAVPETLSLGKVTLPHRMVRAILAEQVYRAVSILAGTPYHKD